MDNDGINKCDGEGEILANFYEALWKAGVINEEVNYCHDRYHRRRLVAKYRSEGYWFFKCNEPYICWSTSMLYKVKDSDWDMLLLITFVLHKAGVVTWEEHLALRHTFVARYKKEQQNLGKYLGESGYWIRRK